MPTISLEQAFDELCFYTLMHVGSDFIHQHVVDAYAAQNASPDDKPIKPIFALAGLYLHVERGFTGREVQRAHMKLARTKREWPLLDLPQARGDITVFDVLAAPAEAGRDELIHSWCRSVWDAFRSTSGTIVDLLVQDRIIPSN